MIFIKDSAQLQKKFQLLLSWVRIETHQSFEFIPLFQAHRSKIARHPPVDIFTAWRSVQRTCVVDSSFA
jgi:hypothetical protein